MNSFAMLISIENQQGNLVELKMWMSKLDLYDGN